MGKHGRESGYLSEVRIQSWWYLYKYLGVPLTSKKLKSRTSNLSCCLTQILTRQTAKVRPAKKEWAWSVTTRGGFSHIDQDTITVTAEWKSDYKGKENGEKRTHILTLDTLHTRPHSLYIFSLDSSFCSISFIVIFIVLQLHSINKSLFLPTVIGLHRRVLRILLSTLFYSLVFKNNHYQIFSMVLGSTLV